MPCANRSLLCHNLYHNGYPSIICPIFKESENSDTFRFWHFPILTLSDSDTFRFWHFPILTTNQQIWIKLSKKHILMFDRGLDGMEGRSANFHTWSWKTLLLLSWTSVSISSSDFMGILVLLNSNALMVYFAR